MPATRSTLGGHIANANAVNESPLRGFLFAARDLRIQVMRQRDSRNLPEKLPHRGDAEAAHLEREQVAFVTGYQRISLALDGDCQDRVIVGVGRELGAMFGLDQDRGFAQPRPTVGRGGRARCGL